MALTGDGTTQWDSGRESTAIDVRIGGPGNPWKLLHIDGEFGTPSGGGRSVETRWGRSPKGGSAPRGSFYTSDPERETFDVMIPLTTLTILQQYQCFNDYAVRHCPKDGYVDMTSFGFPGMLAYHESGLTSKTYNNALATSEGSEGNTMRQLSESAVLEQAYSKLAHTDITKNVQDSDINKVINVSFNQCSGPCGQGKSEETDFWAVTDRDSTTPYSGNPVARFLDTTDGGLTWRNTAIDVFTAADATDVAKVGQFVLAVSPQKGVAYARFEDIVNGVTAPNLWFLSTGFTSNFPNVIAAIDGATVFVAGDGGRIWRSYDGGISFTSIDAGVTTANDYNSVAFASAQLGWFGADSNTLVRYIGGALSPVTVQDVNLNTPTGNILVVAVPPGRGNEVYLGYSSGQIWRTRNGADTKPVFERMAFLNQGTGSIRDLQFAGYKGDVLYIIQSDTNGNSRILWDRSGGAFHGVVSGTTPVGNQILVIGDFNTPPNFGINSIAPANPNMAITVGQVHTTWGFIGKVVSAADTSAA